MEIHYRQTILAMVPQIMEADQKDWDEAWKIATKWMENRYKNKFNVDILDWARNEVAPFRKKPPTEASSTTTQPQNCPSPNNPETTIPSELPTKPKTPRSKMSNKTPQKKNYSHRNRNQNRGPPNVHNVYTRIDYFMVDNNRAGYRTYIHTFVAPTKML